MIESLREKYKGNDFMMQKLENFISQLPMLMQTIEEDHLRKEAKKQELCILRDEFIHEFMQMFHFFYIPQTELFIEYLDGNYIVTSEDDITHLIFTRIAETNLNVWKYKISISILKKIKETSLWNSVPDVYTIKRVTLPFKTKDHCKYFLTILGNVILGKKDALTYFIDASYKPFLKMIGEHIYILINKSIADVFKHKYYDHKYEGCRVITGHCPKDIKPISHILNLITVATHFSNKYGNSDGFLMQALPEFTVPTRILQQNTSETLLHSFMAEYTQVDEKLSISYKDIYFLWKNFLHHHYLPFVISQQNFKLLLVSVANIDACDNCVQLTTKYKTYLIKFKHFWEKYVTLDEDQSYENQEIVDLYNGWCDKSMQISVDQLKEVLIDYPIVQNGTTILNIRCSLWDKGRDIDNAMEIFKYNELYSPLIENKYAFYCKQYKRHVNKEYFEKYLI